MSDKKPKETGKSGLRQPKPKYLPPMVIRPALALPHENLIPVGGSNLGNPEPREPETPISHAPILPGAPEPEPSAPLVPKRPRTRKPKPPRAQESKSPKFPQPQYPDLGTLDPLALGTQAPAVMDAEEAEPVPHYVTQELLYPSRIHRSPVKLRLPSEKVIRYKQECLSRGLDLQSLVEIACDEWLSRNALGNPRTQAPNVPTPQVRHDDYEDDDVTVSNPSSHHLTRAQQIYTELTGMPWTHRDTRDYWSIAPAVGEQMEAMMRDIHSKAPDPIATFSYFVTGMRKKLVAGQGKPGKKVLREKYKAMVDTISRVNVGREMYPSDWIDELKRACARAGVAFDNDLANEVLGL